MKSKIVNDYIRFSAGNLYTFASGVYSAMNGNATFPDPRPSLGELNTANQQFSAAIDAARNYDRLRAEEKQKARTKLEDVLQRLSNYVMVIAGNDRAIQLAAGFHVNSARKSTSNDLGEAENFSVKMGKNSGEVLMSINEVTNALTYTFCYALAGVENPVWIFKTIDDTQLLLTGLESLKTYRFRIDVTGGNGQTTSTEEIVKPVL